MDGERQRAELGEFILARVDVVSKFTIETFEVCCTSGKRSADVDVGRFHAADLSISELVARSSRKEHAFIARVFDESNVELAVAAVSA